MGNEMTRKMMCQRCGDPLRGRSDKLFCDDRCRNAYHNERRKQPALSDRARTIQRTLVRNRRILDSTLGDRKRCLFRRDELLRRGFVFEIYSQRHTIGGRMSHYCLDLGYRIKRGGSVLIFRMEKGVGIFM